MPPLNPPLFEIILFCFYTFLTLFSLYLWTCHEESQSQNVTVTKSHVTKCRRHEMSLSQNVPVTKCRLSRTVACHEMSQVTKCPSRNVAIPPSCGVRWQESPAMNPFYSVFKNVCWQIISSFKYPKIFGILNSLNLKFFYWFEISCINLPCDNYSFAYS